MNIGISSECKFYIYRTETGCKAGDKCLFQHYKNDEQPNHKHPRRESDDKNVVAITNFRCITFSKREVSGKPDASLEPIERVRFTKSALRQASFQKKKGPSLGKVKVKAHHQRRPYAMKFEDKFEEETERQQRCARSKAWNLVKNILEITEKDKATFHFPAEEWVLPASSSKRAGGEVLCS